MLGVQLIASEVEIRSLVDAWTFASWANRPAASSTQRGIDCLIGVALVRLPIVLDWNVVNSEGGYEIVYIDSY